MYKMLELYEDEPTAEGDTEMREQIRIILYRLGITEKYDGFYYLRYASLRLVNAPDELALVTKCLYREVARKYHITWEAAERSMRNAVKIAWQLRPEYVEEIAGRALDHYPPLTKFLSYFLRYLVPEEAAIETAKLCMVPSMLSDDAECNRQA